MYNNYSDEGGDFKVEISKVPLYHPRQTNMMHDIKIQHILTKTAVHDTDNTEGRGLKSRKGEI